MGIPGTEISIFSSGRLFYHSSIDGECMGWYFYQRGQGPAGPFKDRETAIIALFEHVTDHGKMGGHKDLGNAANSGTRAED